MEIHRGKNNKKTNIDVLNKQLIVLPRGLETMNKFITIRSYLKKHKPWKIPEIVILAPDTSFSHRIDTICDCFFDFGQLAKHKVVVMGYEKELDDSNRKRREKLLLIRTRKFLTETGYDRNSQLRDEASNTSEGKLVLTQHWIKYRKDCAEILKKLPVTGKESPYVSLEKQK